jgi:short-subunit dehydrogenase
MKKIILITGASSGMGLETAKDLVKQGHTVYGAARSVDKMREVDGLHAIEMDMSKEETIKKGVEKIIKEQGKIDVLWNNAGFGLYGPVEDVPIDTARYQFDVNLFGLARLTQLVTPHMRKQKSGLIINTSSMGGKIYFPLGAWYHATKHALEGFSDCLRLELKQFGIKVVILEPGAIETNFGGPLLKNLNKLPKDSAYKSMIDTYKKMDMSSMKPSPSSLISETITKIINSNKPKRRYLVGSMAKPIVYMRKWLGDGYLDKSMLKMVGQ